MKTYTKPKSIVRAVKFTQRYRCGCPSTGLRIFVIGYSVADVWRQRQGLTFKSKAYQKHEEISLGHFDP